MPRPTTQPRFAEIDINSTATNEAGQIKVYSNASAVPAEIENYGWLYKVSVNLQHLNMILRSLCVWVRYLADNVELEPTKVVAGTTYTFIADDLSACVSGTAATATNYTLNAGIFPIGAKVKVRQDAAGQITIVQGTNVSIKPPFGLGLKTAGNGAEITLIKRSVVSGTEYWTLAGQAGV